MTKIGTNTTKPNTSKSAIAWVRCSTDKQHTTDEQYKAIVDMATSDGYKDIKKIGREGASAIRHNGKMSDEYADDMNELYSLIESGKYGALYAWALDRLGRDQKELWALKFKCRDFGVTIKTVDGVNVNEDADVSDDVYYMIKGIIAEDEMRKKKARFALGKARCKALGKRINAVITYGYTVDDDNIFIVDEDKAEDVRTLFRLYSTGDYSFITLAKEMTYRGWKLTPASVSRYLNNPCYIGKDANGTKYPRIIDDELWGECRAVAEKKSTRIGLGHKRWWLGAKLIVCPECGCHYTVEGDKNYPIYACAYNAHSSLATRKCDSNIRIPAHYFDNILFNVVYMQEMKRRNVNKEEVADKLAREIDETINKIERIEGELKSAIGAKLERLEELFVEGVISKKKFDERRQRVLDEQADLQSELFRLRELQVIKQQQWTDIMSGSVHGMDVDFEKWLKGDEVSKLAHDHIRRITTSRTEEGYVSINVDCTDDEVFKYQYRPAYRKNHLMWYRINKKGTAVCLNLEKSEKNDEDCTARFHQMSDREE